MVTVVNDWLGLQRGPTVLSLLQMSLRGAVVLLWGIFIVRIGDGRLLGRNAGFGMLLVVILGWVLSRGVKGQPAFFATMGVGAVLVLNHHALAFVASRSDLISR